MQRVNCAPIKSELSSDTTLGTQLLPRHRSALTDLHLFLSIQGDLLSYIMATMRFEEGVKSNGSFFSHPVTLPSPEQSFPTTPAEGLAPGLRDDLPQGSPTPPAGQPVFEQLPSSKITKSRRIVITTLLVLANLVQVCKSLPPHLPGNLKAEYSLAR